jgi:hypothetical protein
MLGAGPDPAHLPADLAPHRAGVRTELQALPATLPSWDNKPTAHPSAYMVTWQFKFCSLRPEKNG